MKNDLRLTRLASRILNTPHMIHPGKFNAILSAIGPRIGLDVPGAVFQGEWPGGTGAEEREGEPISGNVAVIGVYDTLVHRTTGLDALSGLTSYESIRAQIYEAMDDPGVTRLLFDIDSPGGEGGGLFDLTDEIYRLRGEKPMDAVIDDYAFSGAYIVASAADRVIIPRTGQGGSVGVIMVHVDQSEFDKAIGVKYTAIYAGEHKNDFSPHEPLSREAYLKAKAIVDEMWDIAIETVARNRGISARAVRDMQADIYTGNEAVRLGLADEIGTFHGVLQNITAANNNRSKGGIRMDAQEARTQLVGIMADPELDANELLAGLGYVPAAPGGSSGAGEGGEQEPAAEEQLAAARTEGAAEAHSRATAIVDLCSLAGLPEMATALVRDEKVTVEDARQKVIEAKAQQGEEERIMSTLGTGAGSGANPLTANAQKRADAAKTK